MVAPAAAYEGGNVGDLLIAQAPRERGHLELRWRGMGPHRPGAGQHDGDRRRRIVGSHRRVAGQARKDAVVAGAVRPMAGGAVVQVDHRATLAGIAIAQGLVGRAVIGERGRGRCRVERFEKTCGVLRIARGHVLRAVRDHVAHRAEGNAAVAGARAQEAGQPGFAPVVQCALHVDAAQAGREPVVDARSGQEAGAVGGRLCFHLHGEAARRVAFAAMAKPFDEIRTVGDLRIHADGWREGSGLRRERPTPHGQREPQGQREGDVVGDIGCRRRHHAVFEIRIQRLYVFRPQAGIRWVGHGRIQRVAARNAEAERAVEIVQRIVANAVDRIERDVGGVNGADRNVHGEAAGEWRASGHAVASSAVTQLGQVGAALYQRRRDLHGAQATVAGKMIGDASGEQ